MFTLDRPTSDAREETAAAAVELVEASDVDDRGDDRGKSEKKRTKEERRRKKEERRRRRAEAGQVDGAVVDMPVGEPPAGQAKMKKRHELGASDSHSEDTRPSNTGGVEDVQTKKRRKGDKDKKSAKHRRHEE